MRITGGPEHIALRLIQAFLVAILAVAIFLALVVPYHATDALVYGRFSREIGLHGGFLLDQVGFGSYARPLFYAPQGWLWWLFGAHEWIGRLLSLCFFGALVWSVWRLASDERLPPVAPWIAVVTLFACPDVVVQAFAGQTDVPAAAMLAVAAVLLWRRPPGTGTAALIVLVALAAVLAKATALPALIGLGAAHLIGPRAQMGERVRWGVLPLAAGTALGLVYGLVMARHFGVSLDVFLGGAYGTPAQQAAMTASIADAGHWLGGALATITPAGSIEERVGNALSDFFASDVRPAALLRAEWLGPYLRMPLLFGLVYAAVRVVAGSHRLAVGVGVVGALVGYLAGPVLPGGTSLSAGGPGALAGSAALLVVLAASALCPERWVASRALLARLLVWAIPAVGAWALLGIIDDTRTLSPAWPALFTLVAAVVAMGVAGLATWRAWAGAAALLVVLGLAVLNFRNFDGLGVRPDGSYSSLTALRKLTPSTWTDPDAARRAADPQLGGLVEGARAARPAGGQLRSNDGRMTFFFLGDVTIVQTVPLRCADVGDVAALALLTNHVPPADQATLGRLPCLEPVAGVPSSYAAYRVR
ncbi:MAG: hypothetical protein R2736_19145 [Solirubrobacterales bacterium]